MPTLVILRALGLGDVLTAVPALRALAEAFPRHRRMLAGPRALAPIVELAGVDGPAVHGVVEARSLDRLDASLADSDVAVNLHGRGPESHRGLLAAGTRRLIAFRHPAISETSAAPEWRAGEHEVSRWCRLLEESGIPADPARVELPRPAPQPRWARGATLIHPGAASAARRWPPERWAAVARAELAGGRRVVVTGGSAELPLARAIADAAGIPSEWVLAGRTDVRELASLVVASARVVCGDTGVAHLATAFARPSVVLFGPTSPYEWGPPPDRPWHRALWSGRSGDPHAETVDAGLLDITVGAVLSALAELPRDGAVAPPPTTDAVGRS